MTFQDVLGQDGPPSLLIYRPKDGLENKRGKLQGTESWYTIDCQ